MIFIDLSTFQKSKTRYLLKTDENKMILAYTLQQNVQYYHRSLTVINFRQVDSVPVAYFAVNLQ